MMMLELKYLFHWEESLQRKTFFTRKYVGKTISLLFNQENIMHYHA